MSEQPYSFNEAGARRVVRAVRTVEALPRDLTAAERRPLPSTGAAMFRTFAVLDMAIPRGRKFPYLYCVPMDNWPATLPNMERHFVGDVRQLSGTGGANFPYDNPTFIALPPDIAWVSWWGLTKAIMVNSATNNGVNEIEFAVDDNPVPSTGVIFPTYESIGFTHQTRVVSSDFGSETQVITPQYGSTSIPGQPGAGGLGYGNEFSVIVAMHIGRGAMFLDRLDGVPDDQVMPVEWMDINSAGRHWARVI